MAKRPHIPLKEQLAAALRDLMVPDGKGGYERAIPWDHARQMTAEQIISLYARDHHPIRKEMGGPDVHWNIQWRFTGEHRTKTAKIDQPAIAKSKRITAAETDFRQRLLAKATGEVYDIPNARKPKIRSKGFPKGKQKIEGKKSWPTRKFRSASPVKPGRSSLARDRSSR